MKKSREINKLFMIFMSKIYIYRGNLKWKTCQEDDGLPHIDPDDIDSVFIVLCDDLEVLQAKIIRLLEKK